MNQFKNIYHEGFGELSGHEICAMMRRTGVTIRHLSKTSGVPMTRIRIIRHNGVAAGLAAWEIFYLIREAQLVP